MAESFELPDEKIRLKMNLEDDVRSFLIKHLPWSRMSLQQRTELKEMGVDVRSLRRPTYIEVSSICDDVHAPTDAHVRNCHIGAEGVMVHHDDDYVHLAFKCGDPQHPYHYSMLGPDTIALLATAAEAAWPGSISKPLISYAADQLKFGIINPFILDPGEEDVDLNDIDSDKGEDEEEELKFLDELEDEDDEFFI